MEEEELVKLSPKELTDMNICPTCLNRKSGGKVFGDSTNLLIYEDSDIECLFVPNPRAAGHMMIGSKAHFKDMSEAPNQLNEKIVCFAKIFMNILKKVFECESVYLCTMCDGPANHYHIQLIPRYSYEERGSKNFVKPRKQYVFDKKKLEAIKTLLNNEIKK